MKKMKDKNADAMKVLEDKIDKINKEIEGSMKKIEEKVSEYLEKVDTGNFRCTICGKESNRSRNMKNHIETHMEGLSFPCGNCGKIFRSRIQKQNHALRFHK